jgi:hypothetical protein
MINEIEAITKSLPTKKIPEPDRFTAQFYKTSNKALSNSFYEDVLP